jgi:membrane protein DedA with SNARE-associated domain
MQTPRDFSAAVIPRPSLRQISVPDRGREIGGSDSRSGPANDLALALLRWQFIRGGKPMLDQMLSSVSAWTIAMIAGFGYSGVVLLMAIESACIPLPSEVIMPFAGYLVASGRFSLQLVAMAGALGCLLGSYFGYYLGMSGGRWIVGRYGRYVLIDPHELVVAEQFFARWGGTTVFWSRLLPVVRTFIAFPAGVARMRLLPFSAYTLAGSYFWCLALAFAGMELGAHWRSLGPYFHRFDGVIAVAIVAGLGFVLARRLRSIGSARRAGTPD